jgi:hypothetical protein
MARPVFELCFGRLVLFNTLRNYLISGQAIPVVIA